MHDRSLQDGLLRSTLVVNYNGMFYNSPILYSKQTTANCNSRFRGIYYYTMYIYCNSNFINMHPVDYVGCLLLAYYFFSLSPSPLSAPSTQKGPMVHSQVSIFKSFWIRVFLCIDTAGCYDTEMLINLAICVHRKRTVTARCPAVATPEKGWDIFFVQMRECLNINMIIHSLSYR